MTKRCKHSISPKKLAAIRFEITVTPPDVQLHPENMLGIQIGPGLYMNPLRKLYGHNLLYLSTLCSRVPIIQTKVSCYACVKNQENCDRKMCYGYTINIRC